WHDRRDHLRGGGRRSAAHSLLADGPAGARADDRVHPPAPRVSQGALSTAVPGPLLVLSDAVATGDTFQLAVFGINEPISAAPPNTVWFREAHVEFFR